MRVTVSSAVSISNSYLPIAMTWPKAIAKSHGTTSKNTQDQFEHPSTSHFRCGRRVFPDWNRVFPRGGIGFSRGNKRVLHGPDARNLRRHVFQRAYASGSRWGSGHFHASSCWRLSLCFLATVDASDIRLLVTILEPSREQFSEPGTDRNQRARINQASIRLT